MMCICVILTVAFGALLVYLALGRKNYNITVSKSLEGKTIIVTGAEQGICIILYLFNVDELNKTASRTKSSSLGLNRTEIFLPFVTIVGRGFQITLELVKRKARVIMACADDNKGMKARRKIVQRTGNTDVVIQHLDVTMMSSVRSFVTWFKEHEKKLDILINNKEMISKQQM